MKHADEVDLYVCGTPEEQIPFDGISLNALDSNHQ